MAVRYFTRASQEMLTFSPGATAAIDGAALTLAWIWKPATVHAGGIIYASTDASAGAAVFAVNEYSDGNTWMNTSGAGQATGSYVEDVWQLNACQNNNAVFDRRAHHYNFDTQTWSHDDPGGDVGVGVPPVDHIRVGRFGANATEYLDGSLAVMGVWDSVLSDGDLEGLTTHLSAWLDLAPVALWRFNQADVTDDVVDLTGGGADQTARVGTSVVTGDDPPGFNFSVGAGGGNRSRILVPGMPSRSGGA